MKITIWNNCAWGYEVLPRLQVAYRPGYFDALAPALWIIVHWLRWGRTIRVTLGRSVDSSK